MGMVSRILPVIGVPLPFVSYGGSSLLSSLCAAGLLLAFARQTPLRGATAPSSVENQSAREIRRANADWKRRLPLQAVVEQEAAERAEAGGHLMQEPHPLSKLGSLSGFVRRWLGFDPEQRRELKRIEQQREAERAREEARAAREEAAREKAERQKLARRAREEAERQKALEEAERQKTDREKAARTRETREQKAREQKARERRAPGKAAPRKTEQPRPARPVQRPAEQGSKEQQTRGRRPGHRERRRPQNRRGGLPAGLQPLHPEDRARRAQRQQRQHGQSPRRQPGGGER